MTHTTDADLLRRLDGEMDDRTRDGVEQHLRTCADCRARAAVLQQRDRLWRTALGALDAVPMPARIRPGRRLVWAAAILVFLAGGAAVEPLRAWVVDQGRTLWAVVRGGRDLEAPSDRIPSRVEFVPAAGTFTLSTEPQAGGSLTVEWVEGARAVAWAVDGDGPDLLVLPGGLRLLGTASDRMSWRVQLPRETVSRVVIRVEGRPERVLTVDEGATTVALGRNRPGDSLQ